MRFEQRKKKRDASKVKHERKKKKNERSLYLDALVARCDTSMRSRRCSSTERGERDDSRERTRARKNWLHANSTFRRRSSPIKSSRFAAATLIFFFRKLTVAPRPRTAGIPACSCRSRSASASARACAGRSPSRRLASWRRGLCRRRVFELKRKKKT